MSNYFPDNWVVIRINGDTPHYKVLGGWNGGYLAGSSWRMNSGIVKFEETDNFYKFYGYSGSCYLCSKEAYGLRMNTASVWNQLEKEYNGRVELLEESTDWLSIDWGLKSKE
jgi:hypothetical protein